jgi:hypothetical protein
MSLNAEGIRRPAGPVLDGYSERRIRQFDWFARSAYLVRFQRSWVRRQTR